MSKSDSDTADKESNQPEGESAAVRARTYAASEQDTAEAETTRAIDDEAPEPTDIPNTRSGKGTKGGAAATSDDAGAVEKSKPVRRSRATRRVRRSLAQPESVGVEDTSDQSDEKRKQDEANEPADAEPVVQDCDEPASGISEDAEADDTEPDDTETDDVADVNEEADEAKPAKVRRRVSKSQVIAYGLLPGIALVLAPAVGFLKWQDSSVRESQIARVESVAAAKDSTIALLSYKVDSVEKELDAAKSRLTGTFKDSYSQLIKDVVIPGAKKGHISTTATVPAAASVSANPNHAVALLFVNQTAVVDKDPPSDTSSSVRVTLDKVDGRWLISGFDPV